MTAPNMIDNDSKVEPGLFRAVMATVCSQVVVATTMAHGRAHGTTVTAFASISLDPPLVAVSLDRNSLLLAHIRHSRRVGVNVLAHDQQMLALVCSGKEAGKFDEVLWTESGGLPRITGSAGWLACEVWDEIVIGDHVLVVGLVVDADPTDDDRPPLVYARRTFGTHSEHYAANQR